MPLVADGAGGHQAADGITTLVDEALVQPEKLPLAPAQAFQLAQLFRQVVGVGQITDVDGASTQLVLGVTDDGAEALVDPLDDAGGTEPTLTDCDLALGYLNPDFFLGGRVKLNKEKAIQAIKSKIAEPLGMSVAEQLPGYMLLLQLR